MVMKKGNLQRGNLARVDILVEPDDADRFGMDPLVLASNAMRRQQSSSLKVTGA